MDKIKLAVFDLDGTLVNSLYDLGNAVNTALTEFGYPTHEMDEYRYFVGDGTAKLCERALPEDKKTPAEAGRLLARFSEIYAENCFVRTAAYDGIPELLKKLGDAGVVCAVASNKPDEFSQVVVEKLIGREHFALVMGKRDGVPTKPQPDIINNILSELGIDRKNTVIIGDSCVDVQTAHNAGLPCIGCTWGFRGEKELADNGCEYIAHSPQEVFDIITSLQV